jgi:predicted Zn finger-like uncharacterized protein
MAVLVSCPHCPKQYRVADENLGRQAKCSGCGHTFTLRIKTDETPRSPAGQPASPESLPSLAPESESPAVAITDDSPHHSQPAASTRQPAQIGPYVVRGRLGGGAMGEVWRGYDPELDREVAIKTVRAEHSADPEYLQRFLREARHAARLHHTNTARIYRVGTDGASAYIAMELVDGGSLEKAVKDRRPLDWREATRVIRDAATGLAAAHEEGLVHRDIKPANLMRTHSGVTKVVDFGLSRARTASVQLTQHGMVVGTPAYLAPELWKGKEADARSDLYALTCTYYCLLTGRVPFEATQIPALGYQHSFEPLPDPRQWAADLPDGVCRILARGAAKEPADRYQTAAELLAELDAVLAAPDESLTFGSPFPATTDSDAIEEPSTLALPAIEIGPTTTPHVKPSRQERSKYLGKRRFADTSPKRWMVLVAGGLASMALILCGIVLLVRTPHGEVRIELIDPPPDVAVTVDKATIDVAGLDELLRFRVGEHQLEVTASGFETFTRRFTVGREGNPALKVELVREPQTAPPLAVAPFDAAAAKTHQVDWAAHLKVAVEITNSIGMKLTLIPPGEFLMGADKSDRDARNEEKPQHRVRITKPFYFGVYEVTQADYELVMGMNPSRFKEGGQLPVETVSWEDAQEFCRKLTALPEERQAGAVYRLPTEAEWEHACRAGTTFRYGFDESKGALSDHAWYLANAPNTTHPVGKLKPNAWGLYDMLGNVWEWCQNWYDSSYHATSPVDDPTGPATGSNRVSRGCSWMGFLSRCRVSSRGSNIPSERLVYHGFRVVRSVAPEPTGTTVPPGTVASLPASNTGRVSMQPGDDDGKTDCWIDLMQLVDLKRDKVGNENAWSRKTEGIETTDGGETRLSIPLAVQGSYDLQLEFTRNSGRFVVLLLPVASTSCMLVLHDRVHGLVIVEGQGLPDNPTLVQMPTAIANGRRHRLDVGVEVKGNRAAIRVLLDQRPLTQWEGPLGSLRPDGYWAGPMPGQDRIGLGTFGCSICFHNVRLWRREKQAAPVEILPAALPPSEPGASQSTVRNATAPAVPAPTELLEVTSVTGNLPRDRWLNLLPGIDPQRDQAGNEGTWSRDPTGLRAQGPGTPRLSVPFPISGSYDLQIELTRTSGQMISLLLPVGGRSCQFFLQRRLHGMAVIDGFGLPDNPTVVQTAQGLTNGRRYRLDLGVTVQGDRAAIQVFLDGGLLTHWDGPLTSLQPDWFWARPMPSQDRIGLAVQNSDVCFHAVRLWRRGQRPAPAADQPTLVTP